MTQNHHKYSHIETMVSSSETHQDIRDEVRILYLGILHHPTQERIGQIARVQFDRYNSFKLSRISPNFTGRHEKGDGEPLLDPHLSRTPISIRRLSDTRFEFQPNGKPGNVSINGRLLSHPIEADIGELGDDIIIGLSNKIILSLFRGSVADNIEVEGDPLIGVSRAVSQVRRQIRSVSKTDVPVMIFGETGTGKELIAQSVHTHSLRSQKRMVSTNMAAILPTLAAAELFGVRKGAFTDSAEDKAGLFEQADGGTLFLDEIGNTPKEVQPMLLRVLEEKNVRRLGGRTARPVDVRIIAATDQLDIVSPQTSSFNQPLFRRLDGYTIHVPPLRQRRIDVGLLLNHFLQEVAGNIGAHSAPQLSFDTALSMSLYDWPGNVRELRNAAQKLCLGDTAFPLPSAKSPEDLLIVSTEHDRVKENTRPFYRSPSEITETMMIEALNQNEWVIKAAATALNISRTSMYEVMRRYNAQRNIEDISDREISEVVRTASGGLGRWAARLRVSRNDLRQRLAASGILESSDIDLKRKER